MLSLGCSALGAFTLRPMSKINVLLWTHGAWTLLKKLQRDKQNLKPFEAHPGQQRLLHVYQSKRLKVCNPLRLNMTWSMCLNISARLLNCRVVVNNHTAPLLWCGFVPSLETFRMWLHKDLKPQQQQQEQQEQGTATICLLCGSILYQKVILSK